MTRPEAIEFLKFLKSQTDICYACKECLSWDGCELQAVIDLLEKEQENDDRMDAFRFATFDLEKTYPKFVQGVRKAWEENNRIPKEREEKKNDEIQRKENND